MSPASSTFRDVLVERRAETGWFCEIDGRRVLVRPHHVAPGTVMPSEGRRGTITVTKAAADEIRAALGARQGTRRTGDSAALAALQSRADRMQSMFETSFIYQGYLQPDGTLLDANATSLSGIQCTLEDVVGKPFWETPWFTATPGMPEQVRDAVREAAAGADVMTSIVVHLPTGERAFDMSIRPVRNAGGDVVGLIPQAVETTERLKAEEALRHAQKMEAVGQLTSGIAHDFNNLLNGIAGWLGVLEMRMKDGRTEDLARYVTAAQGAAKRAVAVTQRLLSFSRRQSLHPKATNVAELVEGLAELLRQTAGPRITLDVAHGEDLWPAVVDPNQLENVLLNLCINARDAMPQGGRMSIHAANCAVDARAARLLDVTPGEYLSLAVTDTGVGMTADVVQRAFNPFFTTKASGKGTGLGLAMVYGFARQSGGSVEIESAPGEGTTIRLWLPRAEGTVAVPSVPRRKTAARPAREGETVLVVDDEPSIRMVISEVLRDLGYVTLEANEAAGAMAVLESKTRVDLLIADVGIPGATNGWQLAVAARALRPEIKVLFITAYPEDSEIGRTIAGTGTEVLRKPFGPEVLPAAVGRLLRHG
jgi:signal transduction histidine kinase/CheY-like chemotaxis protein